MDHGFLELLLTEAPPEAFEEPLRRAEREGADARTRAALGEAQRLALAVRETLGSYQRRERELAALYETAGDLTSLRDVGRVLQAIVRRARQLLGTDVAYLTLIDEQRGDTFMRVTEGIVTASFPQLRLPLGTGLGGLVAETANAYYTANYARDDRFDHAADIDGAVTEEGLVAILGVPMQIGDAVIGVLFAANRRERPFAPEEVALLGSLAAHAAIAIENARLFQETRHALADLDRATEDLRAQRDAAERASAAHERLTEVALRGGGVDEVAAAIVDLLGGWLRVVAPDGRSLGANVGPAIDPDRERQLMSDLHEVLREGATRGTRIEGQQLWMSPVIAGSERLGALVFGGPDTVDDADLRTLERAALVSALVLLHERSLAEAEQRARGELLGDLLDGRIEDDTRFRSRARLVGLEPDRATAVVVALVAEGDRRSALVGGAELAREHAGSSGIHRGYLVVLLPEFAAEQAAETVWRHLRAACTIDPTVGAAGPACGIHGLLRADLEARRCVRALEALGRAGSWSTTQGLGAYALVLSEASVGGVAGFVEAAVGPVLDYDRERGSELARTLETYFDAGGNVTLAARRLHVHPNTLYQRLERADLLLGRGWRGGDGALQVHLALRLQRLAAGGALDDDALDEPPTGWGR